MAGIIIPPSNSVVVAIITGTLTLASSTTATRITE